MNKKVKQRILCFVLGFVTVMTVIQPISSLAAEDYSAGGWNQIQTTTTVVNANGSTVGTVYAGEGVTVLYFSGDRAYIEYSASNSPKRGYVNKSVFRYINKYNDTAIGRIISSSNTYYSPSPTHYAGSVSSGEYVTILCVNGGWAYIEYNVAGGLRKRAFIPFSNIQPYASNYRKTFYHQTGVIGLSVPVSSYITVYSGPNGSSYSEAGTIYPSDNGKVFSYNLSFTSSDGRRMLYVSYPSGNSTKYGYIYY